MTTHEEKIAAVRYEIELSENAGAEFFPQDPQYAHLMAFRALLHDLETSRPAPQPTGNKSFRQLGKRDGLRYTITWLHNRAKSMNDPKATAILNSAAFDLGDEIREGRTPPIEEASRPAPAPQPGDAETALLNLVRGRMNDHYLSFSWGEMCRVFGALDAARAQGEREGIERCLSAMTRQARLDSTSDEMKEALHIVVNWVHRALATTTPDGSAQPGGAAGEDGGE